MNLFYKQSKSTKKENNISSLFFFGGGGEGRVEGVKVREDWLV